VNGKDCSVSATKGAGYARAALKIDPENGLAYRSLGNIYRTLASAEIFKQGNAIPMLELADANLQKASLRMPQDFDLRSMLGNNLVERARFEAFGGKDPRPTLDQAIASFRKAMELNPRHFKAYSNLGTAYYTKGSYELDAGLDPQLSFEEAISLFDQSIKINPNYVNAYQYNAVACLSLAELKKDNGEDPIPMLDRSITAYKKSLLLAPDDAFGLTGLGIAFMKKGCVFGGRIGARSVPEIAEVQRPDCFDVCLLCRDGTCGGASCDGGAQIAKRASRRSRAHFADRTRHQLGLSGVFGIPCEFSSGAG
jgi:tetratricopeptide (TPR) repeat protein